MTIHKPYSNLYIKKSSGKTQEWEIFIEKNSETDVWLHMKYGEINGKKIEKSSKITETKAGRNMYDEALKQAETKYNEKINKEGYTTNIDDVGDLVVRPMLAYTYDPVKVNIKFPCYVEPKYDGNRAIIYQRGGKVEIESRSGTEIYYFDHIREEIKELMKGLPATFYLDGELFTHDLTFNIINGLCNKKPSTKVGKRPAKKEEKDELDKIYMLKIKYYVFDCFDTSNLSMTTTERKEFLKKIFNANKFKYLILSQIEIANNAGEIKLKHDEYTKRGFEGIILRTMNSVYDLKKRSTNLLKYKEFMDEEFKIVGFEPDVDGGVVWICETNVKPVSRFNVRPRGDTEYRAELYQNGKNYIGALLIVVFQEYTDDTHGIPRFPVGKDFRNVADL